MILSHQSRHSQTGHGRRHRLLPHSQIGPDCCHRPRQRICDGFLDSKKGEKRRPMDQTAPGGLRSPRSGFHHGYPVLIPSIPTRAVRGYHPNAQKLYRRICMSHPSSRMRHTPLRRTRCDEPWKTTYDLKRKSPTSLHVQSLCAHVGVTLNGKQGYSLSMANSTSILASEIERCCEQYLNGEHIPKQACAWGYSRIAIVTKL